MELYVKSIDYNALRLSNITISCAYIISSVTPSRQVTTNMEIQDNDLVSSFSIPLGAVGGDKPSPLLSCASHFGSDSVVISNSFIRTQYACCCFVLPLCSLMSLAMWSMSVCDYSLLRMSLTRETSRFVFSHMSLQVTIQQIHQVPRSGSLSSRSVSGC